MIKILDNPNPAVHEGVCKKCSCRFEYSDTDVLSEHKHSPISKHSLLSSLCMSHFYDKEYVKCPNCGEEFVISRKCGEMNSFGITYSENYHI